MAKGTERPVVLVVGNPLVRADSMPLRIMPILKKRLTKFEFVPFEPTRMDIPIRKDLVFIDTVTGIRGVKVLEDVSKIESFKACSLHDFDLGTQLLLLGKFDMLGKVRIIGVPAKGKAGEVAKEVLRHLEGRGGTGKGKAARR